MKKGEFTRIISGKMLCAELVFEKGKAGIFCLPVQYIT